MKKIVADRSKCVGGGNCVMSAPHLFIQGEEDGLVQVVKSVLSDEDMEAAEFAVNACPGQALAIIDIAE